MAGEGLRGMPDDNADLTQSEREEAWAALELIYEAVSDVCPPGALPSQEEINASCGPTFMCYAEAIVTALKRRR